MVSSTDELNRRPRTIAARNDADDPEVIRTQIEQTRANMSQTIEQIQGKLSPDHIRQQTKEAIREATIGKVEEMTDKAEREVRNWRTKVTRAVKENPVPAALIGIGVGWLIVSDSSKDEEYYSYPTDEYYYYPASERYGRQRTTDRAAEVTQEGGNWTREKSEEVKERAGAAVDKVQDRAAAASESVQESASEMSQQVERQARELRQQVEDTSHEVQTRVQQGVRRTKRSFWETMNENPLAVGAASMALGALVGVALPGTKQEDRWMGETRDHLVDEAKERTQETARKVQTVAEETAREVAHEAKETAVETAKQKAEEQDLPTSPPKRETATTDQTTR